MTLQEIPKGTENWDVPLNANLVDAQQQLDGKVALTGSIMTGSLVAESFNTDSIVRSGFFKTTSPSEHTLTLYSAGTAGTGVALNAINDRRGDSTAYFTGHEEDRGTIKITHLNPGPAVGSDAGSAAISIDLQHDTFGGTAAQGIFMTATNGPTTGNLAVFRNNSRDDFVIKGSGRTGVGMSIGEVPESAFEVKQTDTATVGLAINGIAAGQALIQVKPISGVVSFEVSNTGSTVHRGISFHTNHIQMGATSTDVGGAVGAVISMKQVTTAPTTNPTAGGIIYVDTDGALKYRGAAGTVTVIAPA